MEINKEQLDKLVAFLNKHNLAVISYVDGSEPRAAVVEFGNHGLNLVFDTASDARKVRCMQKNPKLAAVIGWDGNITVQYEGTASQLSGTELDHYKKLYFAKNPDAQKWESEPGIMYFKVVPTWVRYSDLNATPWQVEEFAL